MNKEEIAKSIDEGLKILKQEPNFVFNMEEIKAIKRIDYIQDFIIENGQYNADIGDMEYFSKILNLISKLQKENEELRDDKKALINGYKDTEDILNKRINCLFELLQQEGYLKFDNREQAIDYIDKLIKAEEEND